MRREKENSTKHRSRSENIWKVCLFYSKKTPRFYDYQTWQRHLLLLRNSQMVRKGMWAFFLIVLFGSWLAGQANSAHVIYVLYARCTLHIAFSSSASLLLCFVIRHRSVFCVGQVSTLRCCAGKKPQWTLSCSSVKSKRLTTLWACFISYLLSTSCVKKVNRFQY